jgi:hypothetical protein
MTKTDTKQSGLKRDEKGRIIGGTPPAGFNKHPENRHNGAWKKEETARYKLEQIMKMTEAELRDYIEEPTTPVFDRRMAECVQDGRWREIEGMINQVYGKPQESVDVTTQGESVNPYSNLTTDELRKLAGKK